ncbi:MAG: biotin/lipoyl-binding protein [Candidatus Acetothermia bacterium]|jgi:multidrug efflux pump subunit AcrA (membrane-fusion protein)|nr:biotin/lipoyl-binding protein [Candidatus Acetothermia bacterium]
MRKRWKWAGGIVLVLLAAGVGWYGWQRWTNRDGNTPQSQSLGPTVRVERGDILQMLTVVGEVIPNDEATFTFQEGKLVELRVSEGDAVEKGQILAVLDSTQEELALLRAERTLAEARAAGVPSTIREKELEYKIATANYETTTIRAPFRGIVARVEKSAGQYRVSVLDTTALFIAIEVSELDVRQLAVGQRGQATFDAVSGRAWTAEVVRVGLQAVKSGGGKVVPAVLRISNPTSAILPGFSVKVDIVTAEARGVLRVPVSALMQLPQRWGVAVVKDGTATLRPVEVGVVSELYAEIKAGLEEGEEVLLYPAQAREALQPAPTDAARPAGRAAPRSP